MAGFPDDLIICRCNEVTAQEIREAINKGARTVREVKRRTRAGMGLCQGKSCGKIVSGIIAAEAGISPAAVETDTPRFPVRPVKIKHLLQDERDE